MARIITKFEAHCADEHCKAFLPVGSPARYYGKGRIYGVHCHAPSKDATEEREQIRAYKRAKQQERERDFGLEREELLAEGEGI